MSTLNLSDIGLRMLGLTIYIELLQEHSRKRAYMKRRNQHIQHNREMLSHIESDTDYHDACIENYVLDSVEREELSFHSVKLSSVQFSQVEFIKTIFSDCIIEGSTITLCNLLDNTILRCTFSTTLCAGVDFSGSRLEKVTFKGAKISNCYFRFCTIKSLVFDDCIVENIDFTGSKIQVLSFPHTTIHGITLRETTHGIVDFSQATQLSELGDISWYKGATVNKTQVLELAEEMALTLGLVIKQ